jgi:hypothetical protein
MESAHESSKDFLFQEILGSSCWTKLEAGASPGDDVP